MVVVKWLLKICFGKIFCVVLCKIVDGEDYVVLLIIDDLMIFGEIEVVLRVCKVG